MSKPSTQTVPIGTIFNKLTTIELPVYVRDKQAKMVMVICSCGENIFRAKLSSLRNGKTKQCSSCAYSVHYYNKNFFTKLNKLNCYWAGFIAADGSLSDTNNSLSIGLAKKDLCHLELFKRDIEYTGPILYDRRTKSYRINLYSATKLSYTLENTFNVVNNKSLTLKPPTELTDKELIKCFIVGYIDGDGCIKICKRDRSLILDISSGSLCFVKWIKQQLEQFYKLPDKMIYSYANINIHTYRLQANAIQVLDDLNSVTTRTLIRKWSKIEHYKLIHS